MTSFAHSRRAERNRRVKALALLPELYAAGYTPDDVLSIPDKARRALERAAGVRPCSDLTWRLAARLLAAQKPVRLP